MAGSVPEAQTLETALPVALSQGRQPEDSPYSCAEASRDQHLTPRSMISECGRRAEDRDRYLSAYTDADWMASGEALGSSRWLLSAEHPVYGPEGALEIVPEGRHGAESRVGSMTQPSVEAAGTQYQFRQSVLCGAWGCMRRQGRNVSEKVDTSELSDASWIPCPQEMCSARWPIQCGGG